MLAAVVRLLKQEMSANPCKVGCETVLLSKGDIAFAFAIEVKRIGYNIILYRQ